MHHFPAAFIALCLSISTLCGGAAQASPTTQPASVGDDRQSAFFRRTLVDAYETVGSRNPAWDADARKVLQLAVERWRAPDSDRDVDWQIVIYGDRAIAHGCDDVAVLYTALRCHLTVDISMKGAVLGRLDAALANCRHAPYIRVFAMARLLELCKNPQRSEQLLQGIYDALPSMLAEKDFPQDNTALLCCDLTSLGVQRDGDRKPMIDKFHSIMVEALPDSAIPDLFLGRAYWRYSWDAPGVGVPQPPGTARSERHAIGRLALERALAKDPHLAAASAAMVGTMVDSGIIGAEMESYFQRAIADDPNCLAACRYKIGALNTGAPGADENVLNFGRACLATRRWSSGIPFLLLGAHRTVAGADGNPEFYQANPQAWQDVRDLYEGYFAHNPRSVTQRINYAKLALAVGHPEIAQKQIDDLKSLAVDPIFKIIIAEQERGVAAALRAAKAAPPIP